MTTSITFRTDAELKADVEESSYLQKEYKQ